MEGVLWVALGGGIGSGLRYGISRWLAPIGESGWPWGTFAVNLMGAFVLAFIANRLGSLEHGHRLLLTTGLMGGFTTYSTFNFEVLQLAHGGRGGLAFAYVAATVLGALVLGFVGWRLGT